MKWQVMYWDCWITTPAMIAALWTLDGRPVRLVETHAPDRELAGEEVMA